VELRDAVTRRHMVRSFSDRPIRRALVDDLVALALRAPTAGNTGGTAWLVLDEPEAIGRYWHRTTTAEWRHASGRWRGLSGAPVVALSLASPAAYGARYAESDKAESGLGFPPGSGEAWPVPYWFGDAAFSTMTLLLAATDVGLASCFLGNFRGESELLEEFSVPSGWRLFGTVLLGHADGNDHPSPSLRRVGPCTSERLHRGTW
jgi:nitroreductase